VLFTRSGASGVSLEGSSQVQKVWDEGRPDGFGRDVALSETERRADRRAFAPIGVVFRLILVGVVFGILFRVFTGGFGSLAEFCGVERDGEPGGGAVSDAGLNMGLRCRMVRMPCSTFPGLGRARSGLARRSRGSPRTRPTLQGSATKPGWPGFGGDGTFRTPPNPPRSLRERICVSQSYATLNATVNPNGAQLTSCRFEYAPLPLTVERALLLAGQDGGKSGVPSQADPRQRQHRLPLPSSQANGGGTTMR